MDILAKKKAAPKSSKTAVKEGSLDSEAGAAGDKKPGQTKGRKVIKRQPSSLDSDSDSDFGSKPSKSVAAKVCTLPPVRAEGVPQSAVPVILAAKARQRQNLLCDARLCRWVWGKRGEKRGRAHVLIPDCWFGRISPNNHFPRDTVLRFMLRERSLFMLGFVIHFLTMLSLQKSKLEDDDSFTVDSTARMDSLVAAVPHTRPGRLKKPVRYLEESDEDDMF